MSSSEYQALVRADFPQFVVTAALTIQGRHSADTSGLGTTRGNTASEPNPEDQHVTRNLAHEPISVSVPLPRLPPDFRVVDTKGFAVLWGDHSDDSAVSGSSPEIPPQALGTLESGQEVQPVAIGFVGSSPDFQTMDVDTSWSSPEIRPIVSDILAVGADSTLDSAQRPGSETLTYTTSRFLHPSPASRRVVQDTQTACPMEPSEPTSMTVEASDPMRGTTTADAAVALTDSPALSQTSLIPKRTDWVNLADEEDEFHPGSDHEAVEASSKPDKEPVFKYKTTAEPSERRTRRGTTYGWI